MILASLNVCRVGSGARFAGEKVYALNAEIFS
jgi:hypothetical protein